MKRWILAVGIVLSFMLMPALASAQTPTDPDEGFIFRANGDVTVAPDEVIGTIIVANGDAIVRGEVTDTVIVIGGDATIEGTVGGDAIVVDGTLSLAQDATVKNVTLVSSTLDRADGATVTGNIDEEDNYVSLGWGAAVFTLLMWGGVTLALLIATVVFAVYGGRQLAAAGETLRHQVGMSIVTALALWIGLPIIAVLAFITVIGIPLGIAIFLVVMPALWFLGYLVSGSLLGEAIMRAFRGGEATQQRWLTALVGVLILQLVGLIPGLGPVIAVLAGLGGAGALVFWLVGRHREARPIVAQQPLPRPAD